MFNRTIMYAKLAWVYAKGICGFRRKVYDLKFVHDDNMWYIDMPWPGDRYNLAMVAGSNHLLTFLDTKKENRVRVLVRPSKKKLTSMNGYFECVAVFRTIRWRYLQGKRSRRLHPRNLDLPCHPYRLGPLSPIHLY